MSQDTSKKALEFWIDETIDDVDEIGLPYLGAYFEPTPERAQTHVIEYSAYEELKQQALLMREALARYKGLCVHWDENHHETCGRPADRALEQFDEFMKARGK